MKEEANMSNQTDNPDKATQQVDSTVSKTDQETKVKDTRLNRIANQAARRAVLRQQSYDRQHNIFTK
jgi:hypothetical protein